MKQVTEKQLKFLQIFLGIVAGIGIWLAIYFGSEADNVLLQYLFIIIFAAIIFIQRAVERKIDQRLTLFTKFWLIGLIIGLGIFILMGAVSGRLFAS